MLGPMAEVKKIHPLQAAREKAGLTMAQAAKAAGVAISTVWRIENKPPGDRGPLKQTIDDLNEAYADALKKRGRK